MTWLGRRRRPTRFVAMALALVLVVLGWARGAAAQEPAPPKLPGKEEPQRARADWSWQGQAGGAFGLGSARALSAHAATRYVARWGDDQLTGIGVVNWAAVRGEDDRRVVLGQDELYGRVQYDRFVARRYTSLLAAVVGLTAASGGFNAWYTGRLGVAHTFAARRESHRLWAEISYDATLEKPAADGEGWRNRNFARLFAGSVLVPVERLEVEAGLQGLFAPAQPEDWRLGAAGTLTVQATNVVRFGLNASLRYLHEPIGTHAATELATQFVVAFRLGS